MMFAFATAMVLALPAAEERLAVAMTKGFVIGHKQTAQSGSIEERVPRGETVQKWSRMITILKINTSASTASYAANFETVVTRACPGTTVARGTGPAGQGGVDGRMDCPRNPSTGRPETFFFRVFGGNGNAIHMIQVAFRHMPNAKEADWARAQIAGAVLCTARSSQPACK
jgi:hypothetical protein